MIARRTLLGLPLVLVGAPALAQPRGAAPPPKKPEKKVLAVVGGKVHVGNGTILDGATVLCEDGSITKVEKGLAAPAGAVTIDAKGAIVTPGLVEPCGQVGIVEIDLEKSGRDVEEVGGDRNRAAYRSSDAYNPLSTVVGVARAGGLTSGVAAPVGALIAGRSAWTDLFGATAAEAVVEGALAVHAYVDSQGAATSILRLREAFDDARAYAKNKAGYERNASRGLAGSRLDLEALSACFAAGKARQVPVVFHVSAANHIASCLVLAKEFGLKPVLAGAHEAWRVAADLAKASVPSIVNSLENAPGSFQAVGARADCAALLQKAGAPVVLSTFGAHEARKLRQVAGNAVRAGLPHEAAITAVTAAAARAFGMDRYGTLEAKKVANLVVWSADPFELSSRVQAVVVRGEKQSLENRQTELLRRYR